MTLLLTGCFERRTYLTEEIRKFVPYSQGQRLIFESSNSDTVIVMIDEIVDNRFSDGLGASQNEHLYVYSTIITPDSIRDRYSLSIATALAKYDDKDEQIIFEMALGNGGMHHRVPFSKLKDRRMRTFTTGTCVLNDVMSLKYEYENKPSSTTITEFYWSLSKGYVRFVQENGTVWDLKSIDCR